MIVKDTDEIFDKVEEMPSGSAWVVGMDGTNRVYVRNESVEICISPNKDGGFSITAEPLSTNKTDELLITPVFQNAIKVDLKARESAGGAG